MTARKRTRAARGKPASRGPRIAYWWNEIRKAKARKEKGKRGFTDENVLRSGNWDSCACGRLDGSILRVGDLPTGIHYNRRCDTDYAPVDGRLYSLGLHFMQAVEDIDDPELAAKVMDRIERRVFVLQRQPWRIDTSNFEERNFACTWRKPPKAVTKR